MHTDFGESALGPARDAVVKETYLSRKPAPRSGAVAIASVVAVFASSVFYWSDALGLAASLPASQSSVFERGEYWRLFTSMLVHADVQHLLANSVVLAVLAFLLYGYYGALVFPGVSVPAGAVVTAITLETYPPDTFLVGASGVVYWMAGFWLALYLLVERRWPFGKRLFRAIGFACIVLLPTAIEPNVSYRAHFIGFVVGIVTGVAYFSRSKARLRAAERVVYEDY